jgi:hypothetical protein
MRTTAWRRGPAVSGQTTALQDEPGLRSLPRDSVLVFAPRSRAWMLRWNGRCIPVVDPSHGTRLAQFLPLEVALPGREPVPVAGETAALADSIEGGLQLVLRARGGSQRVAALLAAPASAAPRLVWTVGYHDDRWVESVAEVVTSQVGDVLIEAYLPPNDDLLPKWLVIRSAGVELASVELQRGALTTIGPLALPGSGTQRLGLQCSYPEPLAGAEERSLGFVLHAVRLNAAASATGAASGAA